MLQRQERMAPVIWDIGALDCIARMLPTAIDMLFYLKCRSDCFDELWSDSEYNFLGYHLQAKLALAPDADVMLLERDFATVVDDFMMAADLGIAAPRPMGVLERLQIPAISELLSELKKADPRLASVVIDLYDLSGAALTNLSAQILNLRREIAMTGKAIKALSIPTASGGLTYAVTRDLSESAYGAAEVIAKKHKYDTRSDRWYVILDCVHTDNPIDGLRPLVWAWKEDENEEKNSGIVGAMFQSRYEPTANSKAGK